MISGLDTCPHLENGTCWRFAPRTGDLEHRPGGLLNGLSFKESARVKRHTSKTQDGDDGTEYALQTGLLKRKPTKEPIRRTNLMAASNC